MFKDSERLKKERKKLRAAYLKLLKSLPDHEYFIMQKIDERLNEHLNHELKVTNESIIEDESLEVISEQCIIRYIKKAINYAERLHEQSLSEHQIDIIDTAIHQLDEIQQRYIECLYFKRMAVKDIRAELDLSPYKYNRIKRRTYYRLNTYLPKNLLEHLISEKI